MKIPDKLLSDTNIFKKYVKPISKNVLIIS